MRLCLCKEKNAEKKHVLQGKSISNAQLWLVLDVTVSEIRFRAVVWGRELYDSQKSMRQRAMRKYGGNMDR
jgi:hypothetical protein